MRLLIQLIQTWQVVVVTVVLILYLYLINYVSRTYHRPRFVSKSKTKKVKIAKEKPAKSKPADANGEPGAEED